MMWSFQVSLSGLRSSRCDTSFPCGAWIMTEPWADPERGARLQRIRVALRGRGLHALLVTSPDNRRYLSGFSAGDSGPAESSGALLITRNEAILITDGRFEVQALDEARGWSVRIHRKGLAREAAAICAGCGIKRLGYEARYLSCVQFEQIRKKAPFLDLIPFPERSEEMRAVKSSGELFCIGRAIGAAEAVFDLVWGEIRIGMTEKEVAWRILEGLHAVSEGPSFPPIVASGPNSALPHAVPSDRVIGEGEPVVIDMGAVVDGYCSDMTRTVFMGEPDPALKKVYRTVREAQLAAEGAIRGGMTGREADSVARTIIVNAGFGDRFVHSLGHGVGLAVHEAPRLSRLAMKALRPGMVVTVEPGIYLPGVGGVRLEDMVLVEDDGARVLSSSRWYYDW